MEFNDVETGAILAGLRLLQQMPLEERDGLPQFYEVLGPTDGEIDELCEKINS